VASWLERLISSDSKKVGRMSFIVLATDTFIWNLSELLDFLITNQNKKIILSTNNEGFCAQTTGLYQWIDKFNFEKVTLCTSNALEYHEKYHIVFDKSIWKFLQVRPIDYEFQKWNQQFIFGILFGRPLWSRLGIMSYMVIHHKTISQIGCTADFTNIDKRKLYEVDQLWQNDPNSMKNFCDIQNQLPIVVPNVEVYKQIPYTTYMFAEQVKNAYPNFLIEIVSESFVAGKTFFISEKTIKPMLFKKPMIIMGAKNYLAYLRQMGFRTFADFWDESYDGYEGKDRYFKILKLIDTLATKSFQELEYMYLSMQFTLDHNYQLLMKQSYKIHVNEIL